MNKNLQYYLETLKLSNQELDGLIDIKKILKNIQKVEVNLNALNYLICNNKDELNERIKFLYNTNPHCFEDLFILVAIRFETIGYVINGKLINKEYVLSSSEKIIEFIKETKLDELITSGKIKNFVDYTLGVEVGLDSNARKNRNGIRVEEKMYENLLEIFKDYNNVIVQKQVKLHVYKDKVFDFVITNKTTNKHILVESSFYNSQGSKISETARSYQDLYKLVSNHSDYIFIWLADGNGMNSIKNILNNQFDDGYIMNHKMFLEQIKKLIL